MSNVEPVVTVISTPPIIESDNDTPEVIVTPTPASGIDPAIVSELITIHDEIAMVNRRVDAVEATANEASDSALTAKVVSEEAVAEVEDIENESEAEVEEDKVEEPPSEPDPEPDRTHWLFR